MKRLLVFVLTVIIFVLTSCAGLPTTINVQSKNKINHQPTSVNRIIEKDATLEKITPEAIERIESLVKEKLEEKNIAVHNNSSILIKLVLRKYEDGNIAGRVISGAILGINFGESAKIEAKVIISENQKEIIEADILVESSRNGWNFSYGYSGAEGLEKGFVEEVVKIFFETINQS